ncbi:MAG: hypothetical protein ACOYMD_00975 [Paludibacter sp.]
MLGLTNLKTIIKNLPGYHTNRKIVVIESDDWGSIRMPSKQVYNQLINSGVPVNNLAFTRFDSLASESDLEALFEVLLSVRDKNGNPAKITANTIVANPDFEKIKESNFTKYYYEPFTVTLNRYPEHRNSFELWKNGIALNVFRPQFHGREHLNVNRWMKALCGNTGKARQCFEFGMYDLSIDPMITEDSYMDALNYEHDSELSFQHNAIVEGLELFKKIFGYHSSTFIAPCYIWDNELNKTLAEHKVSALQGGFFQLQPTNENVNKFKKSFHYTGQKNKLNQKYLVRNVAFEPSISNNDAIVEAVLNKMDLLFKIQRPVIISSHRLNYIGFIDLKNREKNLKLLTELLSAILIRWPDVEFMSSDELSKLI